MGVVSVSKEDRLTMSDRALPENDDQAELSDYLSSTAKQMGLVMIVKIVGFFLGFVLNYVLAKFFGPEILGQYELVLSVVMLCSIFSSFGFDVGLMKFVPAYNTAELRPKQRYVVSLAMRFTLCFALGGVVLVLLGRGFISDTVFRDAALSTPMLLGAFALVPVALVTVTGGVYKSFRRSDEFFFLDEVVRKLILAGSIICLAVVDLKSALYAVAAFMLSKVIVVGIFFQRISRFKLHIGSLFGAVSGDEEDSLDDTQKRQLRTDLLRFSSTMILTIGMMALLARTDTIMLGYFKDSSSVGIYKIVMTVASLVTFIQVASNSVFPPIISELVSSDRLGDLQVMFATITKWTLVLSLPVVMSICFYSETILAFFGEDYVEGARALVILAIGYLVNISVGSVGYILRMSDHERLVLINSAAMGICNIVLNFVLIPQMGIAGAAIATAVSMSAATLAGIIEVNFFLGIHPYRKQLAFLLIPLALVVTTCVGMAGRIDSVFGVAVLTAMNMAAMAVATLLFRDSVDELVLNKIKTKIAGLR